MTIVCTMCNKALDIPTIRGMANLTPIDINESTTDDAKNPKAKVAGGLSSNKPTSGQASKSTLRKTFTAVFFIVFVVAGLTTARWGLTRFLTPTPFTVEDEIRQGGETLTGFTPTDAWDAWQYYQSTGFKEKNPAPYYRVKRVMELQDENMRLAGVVTAIAFVCLMATIFAPKRTK